MMGAAGRQDRFIINNRDTDGQFPLVEHTLGPRRLTVALAALIAVTLAACGDASPEAPPNGADTTGAPDDAVEVTMVDYAFVGLPESVAAGTRFTVVNEAEAELHEMVAFRLPDDEERSVEQLTALSPEELVGALGEPVFVLLAEPGGPAIPAVGDGTLSEPGRYIVMCFIPTGADPQEYLEAAAQTEEGPPQVEGGPPHFVNGMFAELTVK
jgi:hypothetical protein